MTNHPSAVTETTRPPVVLNERLSADGRVIWQARLSDDRGRLQVVAVVAPSETETIVEPLTDAELKELLTPSPSEASSTWTCAECSHVNSRDRRWCTACSSHAGAR